MDAADNQISLIPINVWLGGRSYRIRIPAVQEAAVRRAVKEAEEKIGELRQHYAGKDDQDFIAMCLIMYATADIEANKSDIPHKEIDDLVSKIDKALEKE